MLPHGSALLTQALQVRDSEGPVDPAAMLSWTLQGA